jgi:hypothetical protein
MAAPVVGDSPTFPVVIVDIAPASLIKEPARTAKLESEPRFTIAGFAMALCCRKMAAATMSPMGIRRAPFCRAVIE